MAKKEHAGMKVESETGFNLMDSLKFTHKRTSTLENVTPSGATSTYKAAMKTSGKNDLKIIGFAAAAVISVAFLSGTITFNPPTADTVQAQVQVQSEAQSRTNMELALALAHCQGQVAVYEDAASRALTAINNTEMAGALGITPDGVFNTMKAEIYGPGSASINAQIAEKIREASDTAKLSIEATTSSNTSSNTYSTPANPSILHGGQEIPSSFMEVMRGMNQEKAEAEQLICPMTPEVEKNSCQPGDDPDDYDTQFSSNRVG